MWNVDLYFIRNQIIRIKTVEYCRAHFTASHIIIICFLLEIQLTDSIGFLVT